jgi:hypothetical protein
MAVEILSLPSPFPTPVPTLFNVEFAAPTSSFRERFFCKLASPMLKPFAATNKICLAQGSLLGRPRNFKCNYFPDAWGPARFI